MYFQSQFGLFQQALLNSARCKCPGRFQATGDAVFLFRLRNDLIDRIAGSERSHGLGGHGIDIPIEVLQNAQYMRFKIVIGHVGPGAALGGEIGLIEDGDEIVTKIWNTVHLVD